MKIEFKQNSPAKASIDLHMHTTHSDGTYTTEQLLCLIRQAGLSVVSITDHDNVDAYNDLPLYPQYTQGLTIVQGVELSFIYNGRVRDMLGYGIDIGSMKKVLDEWYPLKKRLEIQQLILISMKDMCRKNGILFDEDIQVSSGKKMEAYSLMHASIASYAQNLERFPFTKLATEFYWGHVSHRESPFFVDETMGIPNMADVIQAINNSGGLAFLAHPCSYQLGYDEVASFTRDAAKQGIHGIEVQHAAYTPRDLSFTKSLAHELGLYQSGGSDYHGNLKPGLELGRAFGNVLVQMHEIQPWIDNAFKACR